ncbi:HesA/MoeB/ThiF family protein [Anaplasma platys]|nr:HesA/MoeB/ThiF family protein [Anaplasma platys]
MDLRQRYDRQVVLPEIGVVGQQKLRQSKVLVVGCGGLGSSVIPLLAATGVGKLMLCDDDTVKISNLNRQIMFQETSVGKKKAEVGSKLAHGINGDVVVETITVAIGPHNFESMLEGVDVVVDCVDRLAVKIFLNDACVATGTVLVHCVAIGFRGELMVIVPQNGPCYRCFFEGSPVSTDLNCANAGIVSSTVGVIGGMAASETIKHLVGITPQHLGKLYRVDLLDNSFDTYEFAKNPRCFTCGLDVHADPHDREYYEGKLRLQRRGYKRV